MPIKMPEIKICGLRSQQDADIVNDFPVSYIGFVFAKSKRQIDTETALEIKKRLRPDIKTVGVFTDTNVSAVREIADKTGIDVVQLHSDEDNDFCQHFRDKIVWKSIAVRNRTALEKALSFDVDGFILDVYDKNLRGGTGRVISWDLAGEFAKNYFTILAGGISPENIRDAIAAVRPDVVDISSSLETDGFKDYNKVKSLFEKLTE